MQALAEKVRLSVEDLGVPDFYRGVQMELDLTDPQERVELLVLGVLLAARVSENVAESAFLALKSVGLLSADRLLLMAPQDQQRMYDILVMEYKGIIHRQRKVEAIYENVRILKERWQGDLMHLYEEAMTFTHADDELISSLQRLKQIKVRAYWICRCFAEAGLWPGLRSTTTTFYDAHVRLAMRRLGLIPQEGNWQAIQIAMKTGVALLYAGDTTPLFRLGRHLCISTDPTVCRQRCRAHDQCLFYAACQA